MRVESTVVSVSAFVESTVAKSAFSESAFSESAFSESAFTRSAAKSPSTDSSLVAATSSSRVVGRSSESGSSSLLISISSKASDLPLAILSSLGTSSGLSVISKLNSTACSDASASFAVSFSTFSESKSVASSYCAALSLISCSTAGSKSWMLGS